MTFMTMETPSMTVEGTTPLRLAASSAAFWMVAAGGSHLAQHLFIDTFAVFVARLAVIALCGALLGRIGATISTGRALVIGIAWAVIAIGTEIVLTSHGMHGWYELLGNPATDPDWTRGATIVAWLVAPRLAARDE